jgi:8-oxo-dGTP diphosphatase
MSKIAVIAIVENEGEILVGKKSLSSTFLPGAWHIPGGKIKKGETDAQALRREIKEEVGIEIEIKKFIDDIYTPDREFKGNWYLCSPLSTDLQVGGDLVEAKFVPKEKVFECCSKEAVLLWPKKVVKYFKT